jgi:hypothetical protein
MTSFTSRRHALYTPEQMADARAAWDAGRFSDEWRLWRHLAAMEAGIIVPPKGDSYDSWDDDQPSERAQLIRAIRETPRALEAAIRAPNVHSWSAVIAQLVRRREGINADLDREERLHRDEPTPQQATYRLREILDVIGQS